MRRKEEVQGIVKNIKKLIKEKKGDEAKKLLASAYKALDKAAKSNSIKKNNASRRKSRLAQAIKKLG